MSPNVLVDVYETVSELSIVEVCEGCQDHEESDESGRAYRTVFEFTIASMVAPCEVQHLRHAARTDTATVAQ
jgi:hypothetical protein